MRWVPLDQTAPPAALEKKTAGRTEIECARAHYKAPFDRASGTYPFKRYKEEEVRTRLEALFHSKCAYCETVYASNAPVDVEHFRPKGAVEGDVGHSGYWWLAMAWANLLPSCIDCNRRRKQILITPSQSLARLDGEARRLSASDALLAGKKDLFPIAGARAYHENDPLEREQPLLINPRETDPSDHLTFCVDSASPVGVVFPKVAPTVLSADSETAAPEISLRGAMSIQVLGLNRLGLVQERTRVLRKLSFLEQIIGDVAFVIEDLEAHADPKVREAVHRLQLLLDMLLTELRTMAAEDAPYTTMVRAWISAFTRRMTG